MGNLQLSDFPFNQLSVEVEGIKISYIEEGDNDWPVILFLHGVPTWSYTFRKIIPVCLDAGNRVIAPDLPGFGTSDKPSDPDRYTLDNLVSWLSGFLFSLNLKNVYIFGHDWGAIIGMILAAKHPDNFSGIIVSNGYLPLIPSRAPLLFHLWRLVAGYSPYLPIGNIVNLGCQRRLQNIEKRGYNYPFSKPGDKVAVRRLPGIIPLDDGDPGADLIKKSWNEMGKWEKPFLTIFSKNDPITHGGDLILQEKIPGARNQPHIRLPGKHFLQEDVPVEIGEIINDFVKNSP